MFRSQFLWKFYIGYTSLLFLFAIIAGSLTAQRVEKETLTEIKQSLRARTVLLRSIAARSVAAKDTTHLQSQINLLGEKIATRLTVVRVDGKVLADSSEKPEKMDNHATRPEILAARSQGMGISTRYSRTMHKQMMYIALPIKKNALILGFVRASLPLSGIKKRLARLRSIVMLGIGAAALLALFIGFLVTRHFVKPLLSMTAVAEAMSRGDYHQRVPGTRRDEIGALARALNRMAESSRNRMNLIDTDRNKLFTILTSMVEGVIAVDQDERVMHINLAANQLLGIQTTDCIGKPIWEVARVRGVCEALGAVIKGEPEIKQRVDCDVEGKTRVIEVHAVPLHDGQGGQVGALVVLHEVTELERLQTIRRDFVANASHELKTPITAIRGFVETLIGDEQISLEKRDRFLSRIQSQTMRLSLLVSDLLALSRFESQESPSEHGGLNLTPVIQRIALDFSSTAEEKEIVIKTSLQAEPVMVVGDENALGSAVANLLDNAVKYTPINGTIKLYLYAKDGEAHIEVEDTGIGIAAEEQERIFERFYRVDKARSRELGGTGLGLAIVRHVALSHGGRIALTSVLGRGSSFRIILPLATDK